MGYFNERKTIEDFDCMKDVVIIGAGIASVTAAEAIRDHGFEGTITIIGEEDRLPYQRPPLSKSYLISKETSSPALIRPEKFFLDKMISLKRGLKAIEVDRLSKKVVIDNGEILSYDALIFATGARPRTLQLSEPTPQNVFYLRNVEDANSLRNAIFNSQCNKVVILGAGVIGLEVASSFNAQGKQVTVIEANKRPMSRVASPATTNFIADKMAKAGVSFCFNVFFQSFQYEGSKVSAVNLSDGTTQQADIVVVGIGAIPNTDLAQVAELECDGGILVDNNMRTSDPNIYAIGDCSKVVNSFSNSSSAIRIETIHNAMTTAKAAAAHICGKPTPPQVAPRFWSDLEGLKVQSVGISDGYDRIYRNPNDDDNVREFWLFSKDRMIAAETINLPTKQSKLASAVTKRI